MASRNQPQKRRALTLDLNASSSASNKKSKVGNPVANSHILTSPDVQMLKLSSPELADFIARNQTLATPTPSGSTGGGSNYIFPKTVTEEQELYVKGFDDALKNLQQSSSNPASNAAIETIERATAAHRSAIGKLASAPDISPRPSSSASGSTDPSELRIKEEIDDDDIEDDFDLDDDDDDFSDESLTSNKKRGGKQRKLLPINMESQEKIKLERKRMRNRMAASKCRKRKLERISQLESKVKDLKGENSELANVVKKLKESVYVLKQEVIDHVNNGCQINMVNDEVVFTTAS